MPKSLYIGTRIRHFRKLQKRTIQEIANTCGLSKSMVSKIETNSVIPSVATLVKIAKALGVNVSVLMEENEIRSSVFIPVQQAISGITKTNRGYKIYPFASEYKDKVMQPILFVANKGEVKEHQLTHDGEEFIYVLEGEVVVEVGEKRYTLQKGDSVYFNSEINHSVMPVSDTSKYLNVFV
ncbi:MAG TPA: XRE family transcriptional regulator [Draconibacterium sp.]|nr:XRE family transcriptional regulator [Draconibacterium sp.]